MKDGAKYDKHLVPEQGNTETAGMKVDDLNPWRKKKDKDSENEINNPNYSFIVPWQMY